MQATETLTQANGRLELVLRRFVGWLDAYGPLSWDHQSYFAGPVGSRAKSLYYRHGAVGIAAVAPMIFSEAFVPGLRRLFHQPLRFPIADAHYAMGFAFLHQATGDPGYSKRGEQFLNALAASRCPGYKEYCWGYPFDWVTRNGIIAKDTPLITSTPYVFEAYTQWWKQDPRAEWRVVLESIARHATTDIKDFPVSATASTCSYTPHDKGGVLNASAYRAAMLALASEELGNEEYWKVGERNMNFVLENQNPDGSWFYAVDGVRDFIDHFHTCFVLKALAKIHSIKGGERLLSGIQRGVDYYLKNLFDAEGLPKPFAKAPRMTVYKREAYDCAECINLCVLLRGRCPAMNPVLERVVTHILDCWVKGDGSFRSRRLQLGWDNVPMHRWAQSQMFRALSFLLNDDRSIAPNSATSVASQRVAGAALNA